jgi:YfiH family protein
MSVLDSGEIKVIDTDTPVGIGKEEKIRADALVTGKKGLFLFLLIADCLPVILYDPTRGVLALAHCGRKSTGDKLLQKVIDLLKDEFGTDPGDLIAGIGPGIHVESYKLEDFPERHLDDWKDFISEGRDGSAAVDLVSYNKLQLAESGVKEENIEISPIDTATDVNFFSHYRSRRNGEPEGRFAAVVGIV